MAEEDKNEQASEEEAPKTEPAPEAPEAAEEPAAEEPAAKAPAPAAAEEPAEPAEQLGPKERRKRGRAQHSGEAAEPRSGEDRAAARAEARKKKAASRSRYRAAARAKKGEPREGTPPAERVEGPKKVRQGIVTSSKGNKTITVQIESARRHPAYEKIVRRSKSLHAHDPNNEAGEGDTVRVIESPPISKNKRWRLIDIVEKAK